MQRMREDLVRRNYAESTIRSYLHALEDFRLYAQRRLDHLGPDDIRRYQVYLREERKLDIGTASNYVAALRFFYVKTLKRPSVKEDLPYPHGVKRKRRLPTILSQEEVGRLIDSSKNLFHYAMLLTIYSTGLRRSELCRLKVANIDSQRMMLRVERGKGDVDREVPVSQKLVETLREYWRWMRPQTYMFPGTADGWRADKPITSKVVWEADLIHAQGARFVDQHRQHLSYQQLKVLRAIAQCRTAALGGHIDDCPRCSHQAISYNSCRDRHCPKCQAQARQRWLAAREKELLGVPYFHVVITLL